MKDTIKALLILLTILVASIGGLYYLQQEDEGVQFSAQFNGIDYQDYSIIPINSTHTCETYSFNMTVQEREDYRFSDIQDPENLRVDATVNGSIYQFCNPMNESNFAESSPFVAYIQEGGTIIEDSVQVREKSRDLSSIVTVGNVTLQEK